VGREATQANGVIAATIVGINKMPGRADAIIIKPKKRAKGSFTKTYPKKAVLGRAKK
jgi:hypothetical protein